MLRPVSYTHLDVYKRQALDSACLSSIQTILGLILADDDDELDRKLRQRIREVFCSECASIEGRNVNIEE